MKLFYSFYSDIGDREVNEDSIAVSEIDGRSCFILCDGLGGHGKGDKAAKYVTGLVCDYFKKTYNDSGSFICDALDKAQEGIIKAQEQICSNNDMKTTTVLLIIDNQCFQYAYIGDSRFYHFRNNKVVLRSLDHSVPQFLALTGEIKEEEIRNHPDRNKLLRVMGSEWETPRYVVSESNELRTGDAFLLCTDGFWEYIHENDMCSFLEKSQNAEEWLSLMVNKVYENSKKSNMDNNSAIAIRIM